MGTIPKFVVIGDMDGGTPDGMAACYPGTDDVMFASAETRDEAIEMAKAMAIRCPAIPGSDEGRKVFVAVGDEESGFNAADPYVGPHDDVIAVVRGMPGADGTVAAEIVFA